MIATLAAAPAVAFTDAVRFATNIVRVDHEMRSVMVTANGKIITEKIIRGAARLPALKEQNRLRKLYRCEGFEERFEMETFEVGQRVKIIAGAYNMDGAEGTFGTIVKRGELNYWTWIVKVDFPGAPSDELGFNEDELELVTTPPPAVASAAVDDDDEAEPFELGIHRMIPGLWRVSHKDGVASMELVAEDDIDPKDTLANIHYKRIKQLEEQRDNNAETAMSLAKHVGELEAELDSVKAERGQRRLRILHLRRALKEIETTSGDNNSVLDAKEALEQDYALASKEALQASGRARVQGRRDN